MSGPATARSLVAELARHVGDARVLSAMETVPRDCFVPEEARAAAWENRPLPIGEGQTISQPLVVARMCELLELDGTESVLDVGTGSGYHAAVLARLARRVISIERHAALSRRAADALERAGARGVALVIGDGYGGYSLQAPYDAINVAAAAPGEVPPELVRQLADGGRMVIPVADGAQRLLRLRRRGTELVREAFELVSFVPLVPGDPA